MNYYIQINSSNIIVATASGNSGMGSPWISIPQSMYATATQPGSSWDASTSTVVGPPANYNLSGIANAQINSVTQACLSANQAPVAYTTSAGVATSFANSLNNQEMLKGALVTWTSADWPSNFFLYDVNNVPTDLTYTDAQNVAKLLSSEILNNQVKLDGLISQIKSYLNSGGTATQIQSVVW